MHKSLFIGLGLCIVLVAGVVPTLVFAHTFAISPTLFYACEAPATTGAITKGDIDPNSITQEDTLSCTGDLNFTTRVQWNVKGDTGNNGSNGSSVLTSSTAPTASCISGDTDIALDTGEVYTCTTSVWEDTKHNITGPRGSSVSTSQTAPSTTAACTSGDTDIAQDTGEIYTCTDALWSDTKHTIKGDTGPAGVPFTHTSCIETQTGSAQQENLIFCISGVEKDGEAVYLAAIGAAKVHILLGTPVSDNLSVDWGGLTINYVTFTSEFHAEYHSDGIVRIYNAANQQVF